jgi:hypothetical protein
MGAAACSQSRRKGQRQKSVCVALCRDDRAPPSREPTTRMRKATTTGNVMVIKPPERAVTASGLRGLLCCVAKQLQQALQSPTPQHDRQGVASLAAPFSPSETRKCLPSREFENAYDPAARGMRGGERV